MLQKFEGIQITQFVAVVPSEQEGLERWQVLFKENLQPQRTEQTGISAVRKSKLSTLDLDLQKPAAKTLSFYIICKN